MTPDSCSSSERKPATEAICGSSSEKTIVILGMHRSGTSFLAGSMQAYGMHSGRVYEWSKHNLRGNRENAEIMALNDAVLAESKAAWDTPPHEHISWTPAQQSARNDILASLRLGADGRPIGFKDPRTLLTWEFWREGIKQPQIISIVRHPLAVAASLQARNKWPIARGIQLWLAYNQRLLGILESSPQSRVLMFDWSQRKLRTQTLYAAQTLGLAQDSSTRANGRAFFSSSLRQQVADRHNPESSKELDAALALYARLSQLAEDRSTGSVEINRQRLNHFCSRILTLRP